MLPHLAGFHVVRAAKDSRGIAGGYFRNRSEDVTVGIYETYEEAVENFHMDVWHGEGFIEERDENGDFVQDSVGHEPRMANGELC
jgi:hypothetical protein